VCDTVGQTDDSGRFCTIDWSALARLLVPCRRVLLTTHVRPDCDAIGSSVALAAVLEQLGKQVVLVGGFDVPPNYRFLDPEHRFQRIGRDVPDRIVDQVDLLMILDTSAWAQLGDMAEPFRRSGAKKAVLDHHLSADDLGAEVFRDARAEATGRLVVAAADHLNVPLDTRIATALFAALATDTGWFRFCSTTAETYRLAARLTELGARPDELYRQLYENESLARLHLVGRAIGRTRTDLQGRLIYTSILRQDFEETGALASDSEDVINLTLAVAGTEVAVILIEQASGQFKISFRSRNDLDCSRVAEQFGGGGHRNAAGATVPGPREVAEAQVLDAVRAAMR